MELLETLTRAAETLRQRPDFVLDKDLRTKIEKVVRRIAALRVLRVAAAGQDRWAQDEELVCCANCGEELDKNEDCPNGCPNPLAIEDEDDPYWEEQEDEVAVAGDGDNGGNSNGNDQS